MAVYTTLDQQDLKAILSAYHIGTLKYFKSLSGGSENSNYLLVCDSNRYVLTICEQKSVQEAKHLTDLLNYLKIHLFQTSVVVRTQDEQFTSLWNQKPVILKEYLHGDVISELPDNLLESLGKEMAQLHLIPPPAFLPKNVAYGLDHYHEIEKYAKGSEFHLWLDHIKNLVSKSLSDQLPKSLIHSDVFDNNIIVNSKRSKAVIMDFEEACHYYRIFDLGMMILGLCSADNAINIRKAKLIIKGYASCIDLTNHEKDSLQLFAAYAAASTAFWRHKQFNYVNPNREMADHYLKMKHIADYLLQLPNGLLF